MKGESNNKTDCVYHYDDLDDDDDDDNDGDGEYDKFISLFFLPFLPLSLYVCC